MIAVITAISGGYDPFHQPPEQTVQADWIAVTDGDPPGGIWKHVPTLGADDPRVEAKGPKCAPDAVTSAERVVWLDGNVHLTHERSLEQLLDWADGAPIAQWAHHLRDCCYQEAAAVEGLADPDALADQTAQYRREGHPEHWGLWATGVIVRDPLPGFGSEWLRHVRWFQPRDQVAQPAVLRRHDLRPRDLPGSIYENEAVTIVAHG